MVMYLSFVLVSRVYWCLASEKRLSNILLSTTSALMFVMITVDDKISHSKYSDMAAEL